MAPIHAVHRPVHKGEEFEHGVEDGVNKHSIDAREKDGGIQSIDAPRHNQELIKSVAGRNVDCLNLGLSLVTTVGSEMTNPNRSSIKNSFGRSFWEKELSVVVSFVQRDT